MFFSRTPCAVAALAGALIVLPSCSRSVRQTDTEEEPAVPVLAEPVRLGTIRATISATGVVSTLPDSVFSVVAHQPARIAEITKNVGDAVKSGEMLVRFEFPSLRAQSAVNAAAAKAADLRLQQAHLVQGRIRALLSRGAASQREMDDADQEASAAEGELTAARAAMNAAEALGQNSVIRAPFNGMVTERLHNVGDLVQAADDDPILRLIDPRQVQVTATVPAADVTRFAVGATARAMAALPTQAQRTTGPLKDDGRAVAELLRVISRPEPQAGASTVDVTLAFDTPTDVAAGTQVGVEIDGEQRANVPLVPAIAVLRDAENNPVVVVAAGNVARRRPVVLGLVDNERIEIRSGVKAGELIITQGHSSLRDGTPIAVAARRRPRNCGL